MLNRSRIDERESWQNPQAQGNEGLLKVSGSLRVASFVLPALLLLPWPALAQIRLGEVSTNLNGTVSSGYTANYGNQTSSGHGWTVGGVANLAGSFYSPNFLSFSVAPYLNQSRANSNFQSISSASGINLSSNIFSGSHFPGSLSYSKAYDSEGSYSVPGIANYVTHGNSDAFGINWGLNLPNAPSFNAGFQTGRSGYSVYGSNDQGENSFHSVNLHSAYRWSGFNMGANYTTGGGHSLIPQVVTGQAQAETHSDNTAYGFDLSHLLPLHGSFSAGFNRSDWTTSYLGTSSSGTLDTVNVLAGIHPNAKLAVSASANYSDNLSGQLFQTIVAAGDVIPDLNSNQTSNSLDLMGVVSYSPMSNLQASATAERRTQTFLGDNYGVNSFGGGATYSHKIAHGILNASLNMTANSSDSHAGDTLGFSTTENYSSEILGWDITAAFSYAQNVQTLLVTYMNSFFNYSGTARRRWGQFSVSAGAGSSRTGLTSQAGSTNTSQSYNGSAGYGRWFTANGSYSKSDGQALETGSGLVPVPVPTPVVPSSLVSLFGGNSYSVGLSSAPTKKLVLAGSFAKSASNTSSDSISSTNKNEEINFLAQYQYRKLTFISGYSRLQQGFSQSSTPPEVISSFYIGVSRWFNFF